MKSFDSLNTLPSVLRSIADLRSAPRASRLACCAGGMALALLAFGANALAQSAGDYRSAASGNWIATSTWERYDGSSWVAATAPPTSADGGITIRNGHTVTITAPVTYDQVVVDSGGQVTVASTIATTLADGTGTDLVVNGTWLNQGGTWTTTGTWSVGSGGTYIHNTTSGISTPLGKATLDAASTFIYRGGSSLTPAISMSGRTYGNLKFESSSGPWTTSISGSGTLTVNGDFTVDTGVTYSTTQTGVMTFGGNFTINGTLSNGAGTQTYTSTGSGKTIGGAATTIQYETWNVSSGASISLSHDVDVAVGFTATVSGTLLCGGKTVTGTATVGSGGMLKGNGTVSGVVTVASGGTVAPGASIGTITLGSAPSLSGTTLMEIDRSAAPNADMVVLGSGTLTYGGTLTVNNIGVALVGGEVFDLFDAPAFNTGSSFSILNLPSPLADGLNWYTGDLTTDGTIVVNRAPLAINPVLGVRINDTGTTVPVAKLATDADGDLLTVSAASLANGPGAVTFTASGIIYDSPATAGSATISYTVSDGRGGTVSGTMNVTINESNVGPSLTATVNANQATIATSGMPSQTYDVEANTDNAGWTKVGEVTAFSNGVVIYPDPDPVSNHGSRLYRLKQH